MRILVVHNDYQQSGGEIVAFKSLVKLLSLNGNEVVSYTRDNSEINEFSLVKKILSILGIFFSLKTYREISHLIDLSHPDIVHIHNVFPLISPSVYLACHNKKVPMVQTIHNFRLLCPNGLFFTHGKICEKCKFGNMVYAGILKCYRNSRLLSILYGASISFHRKIGTFNFVDRFLLLNSFSQQKFLETKITTGDKLRVLPNFMIDEAKKVELPKQDNLILFIGRISEEKGIDLLISAAKLCPDLRFEIYGDGPLLNQTKQKIEEENNIQTCGFISGEQKQIVLSKASAVVIPSLWYEQFPMVAIEAFSNGTMVIAPKIGGWQDIVQDGKNGLLFKYNDPIDLAEKMNSIFGNLEKAKRLGEEGRKTFREKYSADIHYQKLIEVYSELIKSK